jgi:hypothetical protein
MGRSPKGREVVIKGRGVVVLVDACSPKGGEDEEGRDTRRSDVVQILQYIYN